ncbi:MAG: tetratricopeptide repeat protein, partial [Bacteroidales bacterium]
MKRINYKIFTVMLLTAALFSGCGLNKMVRNYDEGIRYTPETNPLENHGGQVAADVTGTISEGYFQRNAVLELTPVLKYEGGEQELSTVTLRGSSTTTEGKMINQDQSTKVEMNNVIEFQPEMRESELVIRGRLYREGRENNAEELPERKVADGVINTSQQVDLEAMATAIAPDEYEKETIVTQRANLYFAYMRYNINMRLPLNSSQEAQENMSNLEEFMTRGWEIQSIEVNAWASPEGEVALNRSLSENRAEAGEKFLNDMIDRLNRQQDEEDEEIEHPEFEVEARGEDYDGFMAALEESDIQDKQAIANVINTLEDPAEREKRIRDMTVIYAEVEEILEPLRRAEFVVHAYEPKKTDDEILDLAQNNPSELDAKEMLYAASLTDDLQTKLEIYEAAQEAFPRDYRGFNNAGAIYLEMNQVDQAAKALERANQLQPNNAYVQNNLGVVAARNGDF